MTSNFEQWADKVWNFAAVPVLVKRKCHFRDFRKDITIEVYNEVRSASYRLQIYFAAWVSEFQSLS